MERHLVLALVAVVAVVAFPAPAGNLPQWKIVYGSAEATEGRAVELLTSDVGNILLREPGVYATHVLPAWRASVDPATNGNAFVIGTLADNPVLARYLKPNEVPLGYREAHAAARMIHAMGPNVEMNMAAQLNGPIRFPTVLVADLFWSSQEAADVVFKRALGARMVK